MDAELIPFPGLGDEHHSESCDLGEDCDCQPVHGRRGPSPGARGCWAVKADGTPCRAARRGDGDYCNAHSGMGVAANPAQYAPLAQAKAAENRRVRATLRAALGITRPDTLRGMVRARAYVERERIAAAAVAGATSPDVPIQARARHALALLEAVEPREHVSVEVSAPASAEDVGSLGLAELRALLG